MKIAIVAATGGVGRLLVDRALSSGHDVTAVARRPSGFAESVRTAVADFSQPADDALAATLAGVDAVVSCLGPTTRKDAGIVETATRTIVRAADTAGVQPFAMISATPVGTTASPLRPAPPASTPATTSSPPA